MAVLDVDGSIGQREKKHGGLDYVVVIQLDARTTTPMPHLDVLLGDGHETAVGTGHALHEHLRRSPLQALDQSFV